MPPPALQPRNRLRPIAAVATWVFWLAVLATVTTVIRALTGQGPLFGAHIGGPSPTLKGICVDAAPVLLQHAATGLSQPGLAAGVRAAWTAAALCAAHPTTAQHLAAALTALPIGLLRLGALYLAMRLARAAARDGVYTAAAARQVLLLGWWLLAGGLVAIVAEAFARLNLLTWHVDWGQWPVAWSVSWPVAWIAVGLIVFARIMRIGAEMRADLEGTV
jgi:hypothetical protein